MKKYTGEKEKGRERGVDWLQGDFLRWEDRVVVGGLYGGWVCGGGGGTGGGVLLLVVNTSPFNPPPPSMGYDTLQIKLLK